MYKANIEATMLDADTADWLATDIGWLQAQWPECRRQAIDAGKTITGNPALDRYDHLRTTDDGELYNFEFNVPTSN